ncbi:MAG: tetratricopeptide repeat protein [Gemmatimonadetes bacterium]|nr:tetratricopeptide repeat protein [Gemmatimonadota bacterium]
MPRKSVKVLKYLLPLTFALFGTACEQEAPEEQTTLPPRARWHNNQGVVYMDQHNYTRGREEFQRALTIAPDYAGANANLGIAYYALGKYDSAATALQNAIAIAPELLHANYALGLIYNAQGKEHQKALEALQKVAAADLDDPHVRYYMGQIKAKLEQSDAAIDDFQEAIRLDPYNVSAYYGLANLYRRIDRQDDWRKTLEHFNQLSQAGHQGVSSSYQGQGKYAEAVADAGGANPELDDQAGRFRFASIGTAPATPARFAALANYNADHRPDALAGTTELALFASGNEKEPNTPFAPPQAFKATGASFGDIDNDGGTDLILSGTDGTLLYRATDPGHWSTSVKLPVASALTVFGDADHDGDLDLLTLGSRVHLLTNDGEGQFTDISAAAGFAGAKAHQALFSDFDNDRDVDIVLLSSAGLQVYTNNRDGTFTEIAAELGLDQAKGSGLAIEDFNQDSYMDLALVSDTGQLQIYHNRDGQAFAIEDVSSSTPLPQHLLSADLDNDGDLDLAAYGDGPLQLLAYTSGQFQRQEALDSTSGAALLADFDSDGRIDIWTNSQVLANQNEGGRWIKIAAQGLNSNRAGIGAKVEIKTANRLQKREVRSQTHTGELNFGVAASDSVEFIRILWPGGVRQTELATGAGQRLELTELDRKGTSCPILYAWDGERYRFVSDILGGAIIGYLTAPNQYNSPDTDEYLRLGPLAPKDGRYVLQLANQLEEVIYIDALELVAIDHPIGADVYPNERLLSQPPYPEFGLYPLRKLRAPVAAIDHQGVDALSALEDIDDEWYEGFTRLDIHGYAEDYSLELDFGDLSEYAHPVLLGYGWVDYAHSTSNWSAAQRGLALYPPRLEVADGQGGWIEVSADMGSPAGLPKHMLFDLKGVFPSADYRLRITTNTALYWDQLQIGEATPDPLLVQRLQPSASDLHWRGYPAHTAVKGTFAFRYHYDKLLLEAPWGTHSGAFTRFGPVDELVQEIDDRFVIMLHGDELTIEFDATTLPPPAAGIERSFLLYADGFGKDMDFHSGNSLSVEPLPFHGMSAYPYPADERYPQTSAHLEYLQDYNTRGIKGYYE